GKSDIELDGDVVAVVLGRDQADLAVDRGVADLGLGPPGRDSERALEAGRVADREQLLGIGAAALVGRAQIYFQGPVSGLAVAVLATARDGRLRRVNNLCHL